MRTACGIWARWGLLFCGTSELPFFFFLLFQSPASGYMEMSLGKKEHCVCVQFC